jgi:hypothetical protein
MEEGTKVAEMAEMVVTMTPLYVVTIMKSWTSLEISHIQGG